MKFYGKLKYFIRLSLVFSILFDMLVAFQAIIESNVFVLFLCCAGIFAFIIPLYYTAYILEKQNRQINRDFTKTFDYMENIVKEKNIDFENDFEKEISNDKNMTVFSEFINKNKNLFFEARNKERLINDILISTVVNRDMEKFLADAMPKIMNITQSQFIVFYIVNKITNKLEIKSSVGFGKNIYSQFDISMGEGFLGQAAVNNKVVVVGGLDSDSVYVTKTFIGDIVPKNIIAVPINDVDDENDVLGVFALGSVYEYTSKHIDILEEIKKYIAYAMINGMFYNKNVRLTNELKFQNQLIQNLNEDLEMKIKEGTDRLNNILNSIKDYTVISLDVDRKIVMINDGAVEKFNIKRDGFIGKNISEMAQMTPYLNDDLTDYIDNALNSGKSNHIYTFNSEDGKNKIMEVEIFTIKNEFGNILGTTIVIKDMSYMRKLKTSEILEKKMMDIMLEESNNSIIVVKEDFTIEGISKNAEYLIGLDKNKVYGLRIWDIFTYEQDVREFIKSVFENGDVKSFNAVALNTKINIMMKARLITDDSQGAKKALIYL